MRGARAVLSSCLMLLLVPSAAVGTAPQKSKDNSRAGSPALRVCLRMEDDSAFIGVANVRVISRAGHEAAGTPSGSDGETIFADIPPGTYEVEARAPGFLPVLQETPIEPGNRVHALFLIMKPRPWPAAALEASVPAGAPAPAANPTTWIPPGIDDLVPNIEKGVECPLPQVISGVGRRMTELVENLQKFDATEHMENFPVDSKGSRGKPEVRTFDYIVTVKVSEGQVAELEEYRNGSPVVANLPGNCLGSRLPFRYSSSSATCPSETLTVTM